MFYRRKIILALLQKFGGELEKIRFQKLLFLLNQKKNPEYEFIPYKFGCFSYSANADMITMIKKGDIIENENSYIINGKTNFIKSLKVDDITKLNDVVQSYGNMSANSLIKHTYINFPYYATRSTILNEILTPKQADIVAASLPANSENTLYTIGYEGISLEAYLNKLIKHDIKLLVDVRKNPVSMKYGFSKTSLKKYCENSGITYLHIPEVGINSDQRQELNSQSDYNNLFKDYKKNTLSTTEIYQNKIANLLSEHKRIALTCFEANICQCHRKPLAESIKNFATFEYDVKHI